MDAHFVEMYKSKEFLSRKKTTVAGVTFQNGTIDAIRQMCKFATG